MFGISTTNRADHAFRMCVREVSTVYFSVHEVYLYNILE